MVRWFMFLAVAVVWSCSAPAPEPSRQVLVEQATSDTYVHLLDTVGWLPAHSLALDWQVDPQQWGLGSCDRTPGEPDAVVVRVGELSRRTESDRRFYRCVRRTLTHEVVHAYLSCSNADHEPSGLLATASGDDCHDYEVSEGLAERLTFTARD